MSADWACASAITRSLATAMSARASRGTSTPSSADDSTSVRRSDVAMSVLLGTQSVSTVEPPGPSRSIRVTSAPRRAATNAASYPPGPPPMIATCATRAIVSQVLCMCAAHAPHPNPRIPAAHARHPNQAFRNVRTVNSVDLARQAADALAERTDGEKHDIALVMGSGWLPAADALGVPEHEFAASELPGFSAPAVEGHGGTIRSVRLGDRRLLIFLGRTHFYEGRGVASVVHGMRTAAAAGVGTVVLTNGCGGLDTSWTPGTPVLISDHINLTGTSPVEGANFVDLTDLYSSRLRALCQEVDPTLDEGVYVQFPGPHYETPAEIAMVKAIGGTLVGMSTVLEAIAAREAGMEVLGISLVTNFAAGITGEPLNHEEVLEAGRASATRMGTLLADVLPRM